MSSFNELMNVYKKSADFSPVFSADINDTSLILLSIISLFLLMVTLTYNAKTSSFKSTIGNFIGYTILAGLSALFLSFTVLFASSKFGVYT